MIDAGAVRNWIIVSGLSMLGIIFIVGGSKWIGSKNVPVLSPIGNGITTAWKVAA